MKHNFFSSVRHTARFKNVVPSFFFMAHLLSMCSFVKSPLESANVSTLPSDILKEDITLAIKKRLPELESACLAKNATCSGLNYRNRMILEHSSLAGLPEFAEIIQMLVVKDLILPES